MTHTGAIFDMDGILFDTERIYQEVWHEIADELHAVLPDDFARTICGSNGAHMLRIIEASYRVPDGAAVRDDCMDRVRERLKQEVPIKPGVIEILTHFRQAGIKTAVASSSSPDVILHNLEKTGIRSFFDAVVSGVEVAAGKPAPDIFLLAAQRIGCDPKDCYVFEDSPNGVLAGHRAGCTTIMIPDLLPPDYRDPAYDACCPDFFHVLRVIS